MASSSLRFLRLLRSTSRLQSLTTVHRISSSLDHHLLVQPQIVPAAISTVQTRHYAKGKNIKKANKPVSGGRGPKLADSEFEGVVDLAKYRADLEKTVEGFKHDLIHNLALSSSIGSYEHLEVQTKDGVYPLNQIATIQQKSPSVIIITITNPVKYRKDVITAIKKLSSNPQQEGLNAVIVTLPKVSREHREELAKNAKTMFNSTKDKLNTSFTKYCKKVKSVNSEDMKRIALDQLLQEKNDSVKKAEDMMKAKIHELTG